jgi:hypothetical protein
MRHVAVTLALLAAVFALASITSVEAAPRRRHDQAPTDLTIEGVGTVQACVLPRRRRR